MKFSSTLLMGLLLCGGMGYASTLSVYQDKTFYTYTSADNFIGFTKGVSAKCEGDSLPLISMSKCPSEDRLCQMLIDLEQTQQQLEAVESNTKVLTQLLSLPQPTTFDANAWIETAKRIGEEQAALKHRKNELNKDFLRQTRAFQKQTTGREAQQISKLCEKELELSIPYRYVSFSTLYEANIIDDKEISVTQYLSIINRSGIDIQADKAMFYYRLAHQYVRTMHFNPWVVSKYVPPPKRAYQETRTMAKGMQQDMVMSLEAPSIAKAPAPLASYEDAREYKIQNLTLPSTGEPLDVKILSWSAPLSCEIRAYPYTNTQAFHRCSFKPAYQIDTNQWKVKSDDKVINENAVGEYAKGSYLLYTKVEKDIQIERRPIVKKERETGIFGGTVRKKDGYTLTLTNKSDQVKTFTVVERIPTSTTEEIKSKLLSIKSDTQVNYKMLKDGQIEMKISLAGNESKKIEILFEISYDKELNVNY